MHGIDEYLDKSTSSSMMRHYIRSKALLALGASTHIGPNHPRVLEGKQREDKHFKADPNADLGLANSNNRIKCPA